MKDGSDDGKFQLKILSNIEMFWWMVMRNNLMLIKCGYTIRLCALISLLLHLTPKVVFEYKEDNNVR